MSGWIKTYRAIKDHWIFSDAERYRAWMIILFEVNFEPKKDMIQGELITCDRGQSLYSLDTWAKKFGKKWTIQKVRTFFNLLKNDKMITTEGLRKTTRLTVCNYDTYQSDQQTSNKQITDRQQTGNKQITTTKEGKEYKKNKNNINVFFESFKSITGKNIRVIDDKSKKQFNARIKEGYTLDDLIQATKNCKADPYHIENPKFLTLEFITRSDKLQKYLNDGKSQSQESKLPLWECSFLKSHYVKINAETGEKAAKMYYNETGAIPDKTERLK